MKEDENNHIKGHVNQVKQEKAGVEPRADMPGVELLYDKYGRDNPSVRSALTLWEKYPDISLEQALVSLVDKLVEQNNSLHASALDMIQNSTRPVVISGNSVGTRIVTGNNNNVRNNS